MNEHLRAAAGAVRRPAAVAPVAAAVALTAVCTPGLDDGGTALQVSRGAAVLLAVAVAAATDEPLARLLDASPTPWSARVVARLVPVALVVALAWTGVVGWASVHGDVPVAALTLELAALAGLACGLAAALRRWTGVAEPAALAGPLVGGLFLAAGLLPRAHGLLEAQAWGPPWQAAHWRWSALLVAAAALLVVALSDPCTARRRRA